MKSRKIGSKIYKLIREGGNEEAKKNMLEIKGEKITSYGKKIVHLEMSDQFISIWTGNQKLKDESSHMEINLYVLNRIDNSLWIGGLVESEDIIESKLLFPKSIEYMCALSSMKNFIGDLFLMRPHDVRILEVMDMIGNKPKKKSAENYLKVLYKMIIND